MAYWVRACVALTCSRPIEAVKQIRRQCEVVCVATFPVEGVVIVAQAVVVQYVFDVFDRPLMRSLSDRRGDSSLCPALEIARHAGVLFAQKRRRHAIVWGPSVQIGQSVRHVALHPTFCRDAFPKRRKVCGRAEKVI